MTEITIFEHFIKGLSAAEQEVRGGWEKQQDGARYCLSFGEILKQATRLFQDILELDDNYRDYILDNPGPQASDFDRRLDALLDELERVFVQLETGLSKCEAEGREIEGAKEFRDARRELELIRMPHEDFFDTPEFKGLEEEAREAHRWGETVPF